MQIVYSKNYLQSQKQLTKKHRTKELEHLAEIIDAIREAETYDDLKLTPTAYIFKFEELKNDKVGFASFNLNKNGGVVRLIVRPQDNKIVLELVFISTKHYEDFDPKGVIFDVE